MEEGYCRKGRHRKKEPPGHSSLLPGGTPFSFALLLVVTNKGDAGGEAPGWSLHGYVTVEEARSPPSRLTSRRETTPLGRHVDRAIKTACAVAAFLSAAQWGLAPCEGEWVRIKDHVKKV
jgi:hypothetical protein